MQLILIRHALPRRSTLAHGRPDPGLTPLGHRQAATLADVLAMEDVVEVVSSPLRRARETATPLSRMSALPIKTEDDVREYDSDRNSYVPIHEVADPADPRRQRIRRGELPSHVDVPAFQSRVLATLEAIIARRPGRHTVVCFCHAGVINAYLARELGIATPFPFPLEYTSITRIITSRSGYRHVYSVNETGHVRWRLPEHDCSD